MTCLLLTLCWSKPFPHRACRDVVWKKTGGDHQSQPAKVHDTVKVCCIRKHNNDIVVISIKFLILSMIKIMKDSWTLTPNVEGNVFLSRVLKQQSYCQHPDLFYIIKIHKASACQRSPGVLRLVGDIRILCRRIADKSLSRDGGQTTHCTYLQQVLCHIDVCVAS